jgi:hypothetical protein
LFGQSAWESGMFGLAGFFLPLQNKTGFPFELQKFAEFSFVRK